MIPGEWFIPDETIEINSGRPKMTIRVRNTGDRAIQIGSHYHFFEVNRALHFDRRKVLGMRLNVPAGQAVRFEPEEEKDVELVNFSGSGRIVGFNGLVGGSVHGPHVARQALQRASELGYPDVEGQSTSPGAPGDSKEAAQ